MHHKHSARLPRMLQQIDAAILNHHSWSTRLLRCAILCTVPAKDVIGPTPHMHCSLGKWLTRDHLLLETLDKQALAQLTRVHEEMHRSAANLFRGIRRGRKGSARQLTSLEKLQRQLLILLEHLKTTIVEACGHIDDLTKLPLRHGLDEKLKQLSHHAFQGGKLPFLIVIDIDHFKNINDRFGHAVGDAALLHIGELLTKGARTGDIIVRYGGEEFVVAFVAPSRLAAETLAERLLQTIRSHPLKLPAGAVIEIRASAGMTQVEVDDRLEDVLHRADKALYLAKQSGRDRLLVDPAMASASRSDLDTHAEPRNRKELTHQL